MAAQEKENHLKWILPGVIVPIVVAIIGAGIFRPWDGDDDDDTDISGTRSALDDGFAQIQTQFPAGNSSIFLSALSGPGGTKINVSGEGFGPNEEIVIRFHTEEIGRTRANGEGKFANVGVTIPTSFSKFAPQQFSVIASGSQSLKSARTPFTISG